MSPAIIVEQLSKQYKIGQAQSETLLQERLLSLLKHPFGTRGSDSEFIWALQDMTFQVERGEVVGFIGRNGAGKSTLLKVISKITYPTSGRLKVCGRLAALLEVGTGFHSELTGWENVYLNGSILGMTKREIKSKMDAIVSFAGVEKFIHTPVKHYSTGMYLRLGFAIAAHLDPDVLVVDEVLAVGDAAFQKKCLSAMDDLRSGGRTVLFVSHNMAAIENLCSRVLWIDEGRIRQDGPPRSVIEAYMASFAGGLETGFDLRAIESRRGNGEARFSGIGFLNPDGEPLKTIRSGEKITVRLSYVAKSLIHHPVFEVGITTDLGTLIARFSTWSADFEIPVLLPGNGSIDLEISSLNLMPGRYFLSLGLKIQGPVYFDALEHCAQLEVQTSTLYQSDKVFHSYFGVIIFPCQWKRFSLDDGESVHCEAKARSSESQLRDGSTL